MSKVILIVILYCDCHCCYYLTVYIVSFDLVSCCCSSCPYINQNHNHRCVQMLRLQRALRRLAFVSLFGAMLQPMLSCRPVGHLGIGEIKFVTWMSRASEPSFSFFGSGFFDFPAGGHLFAGQSLPDGCPKCCGSIPNFGLAPARVKGNKKTASVFQKLEGRGKLF